jgi:hypothetical protein
LATSPFNTQTPGVDFLDIQPEPLVQSFIPELSAIGFVQFEFWDIPDNGDNGATVYVNLWTGSPNVKLKSATLLGSTIPVYMSNGFGAGAGAAGIGLADFYFSTPITLTAGLTYYLQVVVQSGDNPWDIMTIGDTYPNGQLFVNGAGFSTDMWFREGVLAVPEPTTLVFMGLTGLLIITRRHLKTYLLAAGLFAATLVHAQTYYMQSYGGLGSVPLPLNPYGNAVPVEEISPGIFLVEDAAPASGNRFSVGAHAMNSFSVPLLDNSGTNNAYQFDGGYTPLIFTNGLWLETLHTNAVTTNLGLRLHGTVSGDSYQLLSATNLVNVSWTLGEILNASDNFADFSPVPATNATAFYRAHHANPVMAIYNSQDALEPDPTNNDSGNIGIIYIENYGSAASDVTVYYSVSGTATNGIDYASLTGAAMIPANQSAAEIDIQPIADGLKPDQTVILTLLQNTNYLIDPAYYSATNNLIANPEVYPVAHGDNQSPSPDIQWGLDVRAHLSLTET